jgi:acetyltransferase
MNWRFASACELRHPDIRSGWTALIRSDPARTRNIPLEGLQQLMDELLDQTWSILRSPSLPRWLRDWAPVELTGWNGDGCGLEPLLVFLGTGKRILAATAEKVQQSDPGIPRRERARLSRQLFLAFDIVAQREIERLCRNCLVEGRCSLGDRGMLKLGKKFGSGTYVVRLLGPGDRERLRAFFASHSPETIRERYGYLLSDMSPERASTLVSVDQGRDLALGIFGRKAKDEIIHAVGRYCLGGDGLSAEFALVVRESKRRLGMGAFLLRTLVETARRRGLREIWGQVESGNAAMLGLARRLGFALKADPYAGATRASLVLRPGARPRKAGRPTARSARH